MSKSLAKSLRRLIRRAQRRGPSPKAVEVEIRIYTEELDQALQSG